MRENIKEKSMSGCLEEDGSNNNEYFYIWSENDKFINKRSLMIFRYKNFKGSFIYL